MNDELIGEFFGGEIADALLDPEAMARHRRKEVLRRIDEIIELIKGLDVEWQILMSNAFGVLGWGGMVSRGANDLDGAERWRYARQVYEELDAEYLLGMEFEE